MHPKFKHNSQPAKFDVAGALCRISFFSAMAIISVVLLTGLMLLLPVKVAVVFGLLGLALYYVGQGTKQLSVLGFGGVMMFAGVFAWALRQ